MFVPAGFFALRTPLLPFDALTAWNPAPSEPFAQQGPGDVRAEDSRRLREYLRRWIEDPMVREALFLASPSLDESLPLWLEAPTSERGQKVERTLVRYFSRMAGRATPFGLFATHALGKLGEQTHLRLAERSAVRKHTRLDMDYVCTLVDKVRRTPEVLHALKYVPNSSIFRTPTHLRYLETRQRARGRSYNLVAMETTPYLESTLERARAGTTLAELAEALVALDPEVPLEDARQYVEQIVDSQLLVPTWAPTVSGAEPVPHLIEEARGIPALAAVREKLSAVQARLTEMNSAPGTAPEAYRQVAQSLEALPVPVELPRLFQVDSLRPGEGLTLSRRVTHELLDSLEALRHFASRAPEGDLLVRFRERFAERYETRAVPLLEALDDERGVGLKNETRLGASTSPLLQGLPFQGRKGQERTRLGKRWGLLQRRLEETWRQHAHELVLAPEDVATLDPEESAVLPDAFGVLGTLVARSAEAVDRGEFRFVLEHAHGPSGAMMLGRFCHNDPALEACVREHVRAEEQLRPDALFAEIVHLPQDRMGNVICRPAVRQHDIVFMGQSGLPLEQQIRVEDLWLSLEDGRLVLRSGQHGREVIPRLSNAHSFNIFGVGVYRFLGLLQNQDQRGFSFQWGPLNSAAFLPRVRYGRTVFALAQWNLGRPQLGEWRKLRPAERLEAFQRFRQQMRLPRWVCLKDGDNVLPLDLDNTLSLETLLHLIKDRPYATLEELYPGPEELCVDSGEGRYIHELVVPFVRTAPALPVRKPKGPPPSDTPRRFAPGSEWLYAKLYTGMATADRLLRSALADTLRQLATSGVVDRWFFIRYADPEHHVRLRLHGAPERLQTEAWPALHKACAPLLAEGSVWRLQLDTYEREVERYGGPGGIEMVEELFAADSEAALELVEAYSGDEGVDLRWRLALKGMDLMLDDLGLSLDAKLGVAQRLRENFGKEFLVDKTFEEQLGLRFRAERKGLESLLAAADASKGPLQPAFAAFRRRTARLKPVGERLRHAWTEGKLTLPPEAISESLLHMQANRLLPGDQRAQELVLYDFLERLYRSRRARGQGG
ncbi:MAG: lantibiotic dehydratase [Hyalangium sp.]|uniref:lantibiotic dehydratase n=1 Tax=Hyalangium sp. TaxID=2028555 RepID=UPI003899B83F